MDWDKWIEKLQADPDNFDIDRETRIAVRSSPECLEEIGPPPPENPVEGMEDFFLSNLLELLRDGSDTPFELEPIFKFDLTGDTTNHHFISCSAILSLDRFRIGDTFYLVEYFEAIDFEGHQYCELKGTHTTETEHAVLNGLAETFGDSLDDGWPDPWVSNYIEPIVPELVWFHLFYGKNDHMTDLPFRLDQRVIDYKKVNWASVAMAAWVGGGFYKNYESAVEEWPKTYAGSIFSERTPIEILQQLSEAGNVLARQALDQYRSRFDQGQTSKSNHREFLQKRAASGNPDAQDELASLYHLEKADQRAVKWFRRAAEQGYYGNVVTSPTSLVSAGVADTVLAYMDGGEWFKSFDNIDKRTWKKLSARGNAWLCRKEFGDRIPEEWHLYDPDAIFFDDIKQAAADGECCAQVAMARMCETGTHVKKNGSKAVDWYQDALRSGESGDDGFKEAFSALCLLASTGKRKAQEAIVELRGRHIHPRDDAERTQWDLWWQQSEARAERFLKRLERKKKAERQKQDELKKRAAAGDREAQFEVYSPVELLERDAHDGDCEAQFKLGVYRDDRASLESAARQGHAAACSYLGEMYLRGKLIEQDLAEAIRWFEKGAERGDVFSQHYLAELFAEGRGVTQDDVKGLMWYHIASEQDDFLERYEKIAEKYRWVSPEAVTAGRREIEARVTKAQQQEARELAHDWLKTKAKR